MSSRFASTNLYSILNLDPKLIIDKCIKLYSDKDIKPLCEYLEDYTEEKDILEEYIIKRILKKDFNYDILNMIKICLNYEKYSNIFANCVEISSGYPKRLIKYIDELSIDDKKDFYIFIDYKISNMGYLERTELELIRMYIFYTEKTKFMRDLNERLSLLFSNFSFKIGYSTMYLSMNSYIIPNIIFIKIYKNSVLIKTYEDVGTSDKEIEEFIKNFTHIKDRY